MSSFRMFMAVVFLFSLGFPITSKAVPLYLHHICPNTTTFTPNSDYQSNLNLLRTSLASNSTNTDGFHTSTVGQTLDTVYGLFLCRGDLSPDVCQNCVTFATQDIVQRCPVEKLAIIWYDECLLRYSNQFFFNTVDEGSTLLMSNTQNATNQASFNELVRATMNDLAAQAANGTKKFAIAETNFSSLDVLYTLAQCTQDLSSNLCNRCLQVAIGSLIPGPIGGRTLSPTCLVRYETYPFFNKSALLAPPPPPPPSPPPPPPPPSPLSLPPPLASGEGKS